jgi:DNA-binding CsgD family transcriptional regulator
MAVRGAGAAVREVRALLEQATDPVQLERDVTRVLAPVVPFDAWCGMTLDPSSTLPTGGYHEEGLPPERLPVLLQTEYADVQEVNVLADMARGGPAAARISDGDLAGSARWHEVLAPSGLPHELRVVLRDGGAPWGALILLRGKESGDFSDGEVELLAGLSTDLARGVRRAMVVTDITARRDPDSPGLLLLRVHADRLDVLHRNAAADHWFDEVHDDDSGGMPVSVRALAERAQSCGTARARLRTRSGTWLTVHAERLGCGDDVTVQVVVGPSRPLEVAAVVADAYGLTAREVEVVLLVARGWSNDEVAKALVISPWTVQDHLKSVFGKLAVRSRGELTSRLLFDQYLPRQGQGLPVGAQGWFLPG